METSQLKITIKKFKDLNIDTLYAILQLRSEVFVVEQDCVYQDIDYKDQDAIHILGYYKGILVAYTRTFPPKTYFEEASIGRVIVKESVRKKKYGYDIMVASITAITNLYKAQIIKISAQTYLKKFYNSLDFQEIGEEYLEDGIPHVAMLRR